MRVPVPSCHLYHSVSSVFFDYTILVGSDMLSQCGFNVMHVLKHLLYRILVPWSGIQPMPCAVEVWSLNHCISMEVPLSIFLCAYLPFI